ncbi:uncharacterized protein LOC124542576 [Vanessa cardui]|uniref:uncharacterized protein LOC124542576 n=1 Tax=Vanessa cardui TaxID=171605 RepID=UPI001F131520|nr:uncharacterized protein LOC124542576 [Vanessa cardui]
MSEKYDRVSPELVLTVVTVTPGGSIWRAAGSEARCTAGRPQLVGGPISRFAIYERLPRQLAKNPGMVSTVLVGDQREVPVAISRGARASPRSPVESTISVSAVKVTVSKMRHLVQLPFPHTYSRPQSMTDKKSKKNVSQRLHHLSFSVHLSNIRGLHSNLFAVHHHLETAMPHLLFLTETQITSPADIAYLQYPGYSLEHNFKPSAGVCMYARNDVCCRRLRNLEVPDFSVMWCVSDTGLEIEYACVYRSHKGDQETTRMFEYLSATADAVQSRYPTAQMVFLGDFNAHHQEWLFPYQNSDHAGREALKFAISLNLSQLVHEATRVPDVDGHTPNCLDLLLTTDPDRFSVSVAAPLGTSDHCVIRSVFNFHPLDSGPTGTRRVWRYKSADWDEMRHFFASYPWRQICFSSTDPSSCEQAISEVICQAMEFFIPYADVSLDDRTTKTPDIAIKKRAFNSAAKSYKKVLKKARFNRTRRLGAKLASYTRGSKAFWSLSKSVETNFCRPSLPPLLKPNGSLAFTATEKANLLAALFAENSRLDAGSASPPNIPPCDSMMPEIRIRQREVLKILRTLNVNKASGPDGIPAIVLRNCAPELSPVLTRLYRLSLKSAQVPKAWKIANVQPVPKKSSRTDPANYRPIAITCILCKGLERVLNNKLQAYLEDNDLLSDQQYGFRRNRSTGDLLVYATHIWGEAMDKYGEALAVSLDVSKAFDRVWHAGLLSKLPSYGIPVGLCNWISDFLSGRSFRVVLDGFSSDLMAINAGVPQGSILSATLFLLHINDLLKPGIFGYADDSTVTERYISGPRASATETREHREALVERINLRLEEVSN